MLYTLLLLLTLIGPALVLAVAVAGFRKADGRARETREMLRLALQNVGDGVMTTDDYGRVTSMNAVAETITGWTKSEALGRPIDAVFQVVDAESRTALERVTARVTNRSVLIRKDGSECEVEDSATPIRDAAGRIGGCLLVFHDVTHQRQLECAIDAQVQSAKVLASIVEDSNDAIIGTTLDDKITSWNPAAESLYGYAAQDAVGRRISIVVPHQRLGELAEINRKIASGERIEHLVAERMRADLQKVQVSLTITPLRNTRGHIIGALRTVRDVTPQFEGDRRERELLAEVALLTAELSKRDRRGPPVITH